MRRQPLRGCAARAPAARFGVLALAVAVAVVVLGANLAGASTAPVFTVSVNGVAAARSSDAHPAQIEPNAPVEISVTVRNRSDSSLEVAAVRFQGDVIDLPLFSFDSTIDLLVAPHSSSTLRFPVNAVGIGSQATGLVPATVTALSRSGAALATQSVVTDIHGSLRSIYGLFGFAVLLLTLSSLALALIALARHRLPENRIVRALRFAVPGVGIGLVMTFTLAALDLFTPGPSHWLPLLVGTTAIGLALGYLTPAPNEAEFGEDDDDVLLAEIIVVDEDPLEVAPPSVVGPRPTVSVPDSRPTEAPA